MGWRDFKNNTAPLEDKVYKEDKESLKQVTLSSKSSLSPRESLENHQDKAKKDNYSKSPLTTMDKEDKVKTSNDASTTGSEVDIQTDTNNLNYWISQLPLCNTREAVFELLDKFRPLPWSDYQRSEMAKVYHRQLGFIADKLWQDRERQITQRALKGKQENGYI